MTLKPYQLSVLAFLPLFFTACSLNQSLDKHAAIKATPILQTTTSWDGTPLSYPSGQAEISGHEIIIPPGAQTGWHLHPVPTFGIITQGTLQITLKDGRTKIIHAGDTLTEVVNTTHNGRNIGNTTVKLLVFYAGATGTPLTINQP